MAVTIAPLASEVQTRCDALTNGSTIDEIIEVAIAAKKVQLAGGVVTRTTLDVQLQRVVDLSGGGSQIEDLIALAASLELSALSGSSRIVKKFELFSTAGSFTWARPANMNGTVVYVSLVGGGAGGVRVNSASPGGTGGAGGQYRKRVPVDIGASTSVAVTVGAGGIGASFSSGNPGAPSSFGTLVAVGGIASVAGIPSTAVAMGTSPGYSSVAVSSATAANSVLPTRHNVDEAGAVVSGISPTTALSGGGGVLMGISPPSGGDTGQGKGGRGYGAGGAGFSDSAGIAGNGAQGFVLVEWEEFV